MPPFKVMAIVAAAQDIEATGVDVCHMEVGQPSSAAPSAVKDAALTAMTTTKLAYTASLGIAPLRARIAAFYQEYYNTACSPSNVVITTGSSAAFLLSFLTAFSPGDKVVITPPSYPCYRSILAALDINIVIMPVDHTTNYQPTLSMFKGE